MNYHLKKIIKELKSIELLETHLGQLEALRKESLERVDKLLIELNSKNAKIDRLDKTNFKTIYLRITGNLDLKLELYQNHYLELALEHKELSKSIELLDYEIGLIAKKLEGLGNMKLEFQEKVRSYKEGALSYDLIEYRNTINSIEHYLRLSQELNEAIEEGIAVDKKFTSTIELVEEVANEVYDEKRNNVEELNSFKVNRIENYQESIISIQHAFLKYVGEIDDVYNIILDSSEAPDKFLKNFMNHYRFNLVNDLRRAKNMKSSFKFLRRYRDTVLTMNKTLDHDLKVIDQHLIELEDLELTLMEKISKST